MCVVACCISANLHLFICISVPWVSVHLHNRKPLLGIKPRISCNPSLLCVKLETTKNHRFKYSHVSSCVSQLHVLACQLLTLNLFTITEAHEASPHHLLLSCRTNCPSKTSVHPSNHLFSTHRHPSAHSSIICAWPYMSKRPTQP